MGVSPTVSHATHHQRHQHRAADRHERKPAPTTPVATRATATISIGMQQAIIIQR